MTFTPFSGGTLFKFLHSIIAAAVDIKKVLGLHTPMISIIITQQEERGPTESFHETCKHRVKLAVIDAGDTHEKQFVSVSVNYLD